MDTTKLQEKVVDSLGQTLAPNIEKAAQRLGRSNGRVTSLIQDHPAACLFGALALGYLVARLARHRR